jgi:glycosyltransferase involved in cell wall biosynthesis
MPIKLHVVLARAGNVLALDGVNTYIWELASALSETGSRVTICSGFSNITSDIRSHVKRYFGVNFVGKYTSLKGYDFHGLKDVLLTWSIKGSRLMNELDPDIIHINGAVPLLCRTPKVATYHGIMNFDLNLNAVKCRLNSMYDRIIYRTFKKVIAVSCRAKDEFLKYVGSSDPFVIPPMIETGNFVAPKLSNRENALLHRGTYPRKNLKATLLAFSYLKSKIPSLKLYIIGEKRDMEMCLKALSLNLKDIEVVSDISKREMIKLYSNVRLTFFPSYYEAFGYVALESMASGTPVIASTGVANELVKPGYNGFYVSPNDPKVMAEYAYKLLTCKKLWVFMSKNAVNMAEKFSREKIFPKVLSFYEDTLRECEHPQRN